MRSFRARIRLTSSIPISSHEYPAAVPKSSAPVELELELDDEEEEEANTPDISASTKASISSGVTSGSIHLRSFASIACSSHESSLDSTRP